MHDRDKGLSPEKVQIGLEIVCMYQNFLYSSKYLR